MHVVNGDGANDSVAVIGHTICIGHRLAIGGLIIPALEELLVFD